MIAAAATHSVAWRAATGVSQTEEWGTPPALYLALEQEFAFTLDVAASSVNAQHIRYLDRETDALRTPWAGERVFCNPPYGRELGGWFRKARTEARDHDALVVMLVPARTDTAWFHEQVLPHADEVRFLRGRLNYRRGGAGGSRAPFASMVVVFRPGQRAEPVPPAQQLLFPFLPRSA